MKKILVGILLLACVFLSSCTSLVPTGEGVYDLANYSFARALGADKGEKGAILTALCELPSDILAEGISKSAYMVVQEADTILSAQKKCCNIPTRT